MIWGGREVKQFAAIFRLSMHLGVVAVGLTLLGKPAVAPKIAYLPLVKQVSEIREMHESLKSLLQPNSLCH